MNRNFDKGKAAKILTGIFVFVAAAYLLLLFWVNQRVSVIDVSGCEQGAAEQMAYKIENIKCRDKYVEITGYAYEPGVSIDRADTSVLAYDPVSEVYYKLPTENIKKEKITKKATTYEKNVY